MLGMLDVGSAAIFDLKVDIGADGQPVKAGWSEWSEPRLDPGPPTAEKTFGAVTLTLSRTGGNGLAFRNRTEPGGDLTNDLVCIDNLLEEDMGVITMTISGLAPGDYTITTYHNYIFQGTSKISIKIDDVLLVDGERTTLWAETDDAAASATCDFTASGADVVVDLICLYIGQNVPFNGFHLRERLRADRPYPPDDSLNVCPDPVLNWRPGARAAEHDVYFGTDYNDVNDATTSDGAYLDTVDVNYYSGTLGLEWAKTYYWRVDEVNGPSVWKGLTWKFTSNDRTAFDPDPGDEGTAVLIDTLLTWSSCDADSHDVYFGTDFDDVNDRRPAAYQDSLAQTTWDPNGLEYLTVYYWAVDVVKGLDTWPGPVWSFMTGSPDPNLILWYKFDEADANTAHDSSGHNYHCDVTGIDPDVHWEPDNGRFDGCLKFDNDIGVPLPIEVTDTIEKEITVSVWANGLPDQDPTNDMPIFDGGDWGNSLGDGHYKVILLVPAEDGGMAWRAGNDTNDLLEWEEGPADAWRGEWNHFGCVKDENADIMKVYFNGILVKSKSGTTGTLVNVVNNVFKIGAYNENMGDYRGRLDDFQLYNRALSTNEIEDLFRGGNLGIAWGPNPRHGQRELPRDPNLEWKPGNYADSHDIYFGTDWDDVNDAVTTSPFFMTNREPNSYDLPMLLDLGRTYYWRIDEVNDSNGHKWKGRIWRFAVRDYVPVEDFEPYDLAANLINDAWLDGARSLDEPPWFVYVNGATVGLGASYADPPDPVHGGDQSMMLVYDNSGWGGMIPCYSETERTFNTPQDWTEADVVLITLNFYGDPNNDANATEQMYVIVEDADGNAPVNYGHYEDEDMNDIQEDEWQEWNILLADFAGVDMNAVTRMYIGFGVQGSSVPGGYGTVYFDNIRLYQPKCVPSRRSTDFAAFDLSDSCIIDFGEIDIIADDWLDIDEFVTAVAPGSPVARYEFSQNLDDSSGNNHHGAVATGAAAYDAGGKDGYCIDFDRTFGVEIPGAVFADVNEAVTISVWVNGYADQNDVSTVILEAGRGSFPFVDDWNDIITIDAEWRDAELDFEAGGPGEDWDDFPDEAWAGEWNHYAFVADANEGPKGIMVIYHNGRPVTQGTTDANVLGITHAFIGIAPRSEQQGWEGHYIGKLDEVHIYDYGLSKNEVAYLFMGDGTLYLSLESSGNFFDAEPAGSKAVNFRDVAVIADKWLLKQYWPR
jgi:hypothetical protein